MTPTRIENQAAAAPISDAMLPRKMPNHSPYANPIMVMHAEKPNIGGWEDATGASAQSRPGYGVLTDTETNQDHAQEP